MYIYTTMYSRWYPCVLKHFCWFWWFQDNWVFWMKYACEDKKKVILHTLNSRELGYTLWISFWFKLQPFFESKIGCRYKYLLFYTSSNLGILFQIKVFLKENMCLQQCALLFSFMLPNNKYNHYNELTKQMYTLQIHYISIKQFRCIVKMWKNHLGLSTQIWLKSQFY